MASFTAAGAAKRQLTTNGVPTTFSSRNARCWRLSRMMASLRDMAQEGSLASASRGTAQ
jgi:hypothetical protein